MKRLLSLMVFSGVLLISKMVLAAAGDEDKLLATFKTCDLPNTVSLLNHHTGKKDPNWRPPTQMERQALDDLFIALDANKPETVAKQMDALGMQGCRLRPPHQDAIHLWGKVDKMALALFWRTGAIQVPGDPSTYGNPVQPLLLGAPHQGTDGTGKVAAAYFENTKARALYANVQHRASVTEMVPCQKSRPESDSAHSTSTQMYLAHTQLARLYPGYVHINIHGMKGGPETQYMMWSGHGDMKKNKSFGRMVLSHLKEFNSADVTAKMLICATTNGEYKEHTGCPTTNTELNYTNGSNSPACDNGKADSGKAIEVEHGPTYLGANAKLLEHAADAYNAAMNDWVRTVAPQPTPTPAQPTFQREHRGHNY